MRVALTGASCSGKTTLALEVAARRGLPRFNADARSVLSSMGARPGDPLTPELYARFQRRYIARKFWMERSQSSFITDRSFIDGCAYWLEHDLGGTDARKHNQVLKLCRTLASRYDLHFFLPYGQIPYQDDGWRLPAPDYHEATGERMRALLIEWKLPFETIESADLERRVDQVLRRIG